MDYSDETLPTLEEGLSAAERLHSDGLLQEAAALYRRLWARYPDSPHAAARGFGLFLHLGDLDSAESIVEEGLRAFPALEIFNTEHARVAEFRQAPRTAASRWALVRQRFPESWNAYLGEAAMARSLGHDAFAERILADGIRQIPDRFELQVEWARAAERRGDKQAAAARWGSVRVGFPDQPAGYLGQCASLRALGDLVAAEEAAAAAQARWPNDRDVTTERAKLASAREAWIEEANLWADVRQIDPKFWPAWAEGALAWRRAEQNEIAAELLVEAVARFPTEPSPIVLLGRVQAALGEWAAAAQTGEQTRQRFPDLKDGHVGAATALRVIGRLEDAEVALADAERRFPHDHDVVLERVDLMYAKEDWPAAAALCAAGMQRFPDDNQLRRRAFEIHMRSVDAAEEVRGLRNGLVGPEGSLDARDLLMQFESLGGTGHGCEFGIYQRDCGAEPLGLLRWTDMGHDLLIEALECDFEGVGTAEQTVIFIPETNLRKQYWSRDRRFYMVSGTSVFIDEMPEEKLFPQLCRRLTFLRQKMIGDLRAGEKIFVYKNMFRNLTDAELDRFHAAMRRYGDNTLLVIRYSEPSHPDGTVVWDRPGLLVGYIDHFTSSPTEEFLGKPYDSFRRITVAAHALWAARGS